MAEADLKPGHGLRLSVSDLIIPGVVLVILLYTIYGVVYRLYLTPIAHIPGPLLARLTFWNEFYYDVYLGGKYTFKLKEYHAKYGTPFSPR